MTAEEIKVGDYVEIIPHKNHTDYIKNQYGKQHKVTVVVETTTGKKLCKLKGIKDYEPASSLKKIKVMKTVSEPL